MSDSQSKVLSSILKPMIELVPYSYVSGVEFEGAARARVLIVARGVRFQYATDGWSGHASDPFDFSIGHMIVMMKINNSLTCGSFPFSIGSMVGVIRGHDGIIGGRNSEK